MDVSVALAILHVAGPRIVNTIVSVLELVLVLVVLLVWVKLYNADDGTHERTVTA